MYRRVKAVLTRRLVHNGDGDLFLLLLHPLYFLHFRGGTWGLTGFRDRGYVLFGWSCRREERTTDEERRGEERRGEEGKGEERREEKRRDEERRGGRGDDKGRESGDTYRERFQRVVVTQEREPGR